MKVEHECHALLLDALGQLLYVAQVLSYALLLLCFGGVGRVYEKAHAHGVEPLLLQVRQHLCYGVAVVVEVGGAVLLV